METTVPAQDVTGDWQGTLSAGSHQLRLILNIQRARDERASALEVRGRRQQRLRAITADGPRAYAQQRTHAPVTTRRALQERVNRERPTGLVRRVEADAWDRSPGLA